MNLSVKIQVMFSVFFVAVLFFQGAQADPYASRVAQERSTTRLRDEGFFRGRVGLLRDQFVGPLESLPIRQREFQGLYTRLDFEQGSESLRASGELSSLYSVDNEYFNFFNPRQLYIELSSDEKAHSLKIGRVIHDWHPLERDFRLGLIEPLFRFDPLTRSHQGLTGFFYQMRGQNLKLNIFGSPFFVPNQGAALREEGGQIRSSSPWFRLPPQQVLVAGMPADVNYDVQIPEISEIVFQPSYLAQLEWDVNRSWKVRAGGGSKPFNTLALGFDGFVNIDQGTVLVEVRPDVAFHRLLFADVQFGSSAHAVGAGFLYDQQVPTQTWFESETHQQFSDSRFVNVYARFRRSLGEVQFSVFQRTGGDVREEGPFATGTGSLLPGPFDLHSAASVRYRTRVLNLSSGVFALSAIEYTHELVTGGAHLRVATDVKTASGWGVTTGFDLLAAGMAVGASQLDIFSSYAENDRFFFGVDYVF